MGHAKTDDLRDIIDRELEVVKSFTELLSAIERADYEENGEPVWQQSKMYLSVLGEWLYENVQRNIDGVFCFIQENLGTIEVAWEGPSIYGYERERLTDLGLRLHITPDDLMKKIETPENFKP